MQAVTWRGPAMSVPAAFARQLRIMLVYLFCVFLYFCFWFSDIFVHLFVLYCLLYKIGL